MHNSIKRKSINHPLFIDFNLYTEGDIEFKTELIALFISNLIELQVDLDSAYKKNDLTIFRKSCHKNHTTISILSDPSLNASIANIKEGITDISTPYKIERFKALCFVIINSLEKEKLKIISPDKKFPTQWVA